MRRRSTSQNPYRLVWAGVDPVVWVASIFAASWLRYDFDLSQVLTRGLVTVSVGTAALHVLLGFAIGPYAVGHLRGSFEEISDIAKTVLLTVVIILVPVWLASPILVPRSVPFIAAALAGAGMFTTRFVVRAWRARHRAVRVTQRRVVVFGAGEGARQLARTLTRDPASTFAPVALLDDSPLKSRLNIEGVRVRGTREALERVAAKYDADTLAIAVPSADASLIRDLSDRAAACGLNVLVLPPAHELIGGPSAKDLRDVNLADLLGRRPVDLDTEIIAESISGQRVLVTGAGGSIGSELCRQISAFNPGRLIMLDRDESALHSVQLSISGQGLLDTDDVVLADIRDLEAMREVFSRVRPDIVFHAAALKHLPLLEQYPLEAWKSNVLGTLNVLQASRELGVTTFVNISTDKAADPTCVLGYSKRLAERLTAGFASHNEGRYVSVRFGNVLGSRGSVIHAFTAQILRGGPVTVTHPQVERFFMLIPEACQLVLEAATIGSDGEVMVLDMGEPMKIVDVANTLIRMSNRRDIHIVYTGLRQGEKLGEDLFAEGELQRATAHPLIAAVDVPPIDFRGFDPPQPSSHPAALAWMRREATREGPARRPGEVVADRT